MTAKKLEAMKFSYSYLSFELDLSTGHHLHNFLKLEQSLFANESSFNMHCSL
jgi:hypothetical protein